MHPHRRSPDAVIYFVSVGIVRMIRGRPSTLSGGQNKVFADRLMGRYSADRTLLRVKTRERFKVKMGVALRAVSLVLVYCVERTC